MPCCDGLSLKQMKALYLCQQLNAGPPPHINNEIYILCDADGEIVIVKYEHDEVAGTETYTDAVTGAAVDISTLVECPGMKTWTECYKNGAGEIFTKILCLKGDDLTVQWYDVQTESILAAAPAGVVKCDNPDESVQTDKDYCTAAGLTLNKAALLADAIADGVLLPSGSAPTDIYQIDIDPLPIGRTIEHEGFTPTAADGTLEFPAGSGRIIDLEGGDSSCKTGYTDKDGQLYPIEDFEVTIAANSCFRIALTLI